MSLVYCYYRYSFVFMYQHKSNGGGKKNNSNIEKRCKNESRWGTVSDTKILWFDVATQKLRLGALVRLNFARV